jgi:hypothetical protein
MIGEYQGCSQRGRPTVDQIFTMRQIMEKCRELNKNVHNLFVDFQAAYDTVEKGNSFIYSAFQRSTKVDIELVIIIKGTAQNDS